MVNIETLAVITRDNQILLGLKKRKFGKGKWNGPGGKLKNIDERDIERCLHRETFEEAGIRLLDARKIGKTFYRFNGSEEDHEVHVYVASSFEGEVRDSEEMAWKWFDIEDGIPEDDMWHNDRYWLPFALRGEEFEAEIYMAQDYETTSCKINGVEMIR
jgi:8-oxo-dGTP pyrophosphatase MutT (NUDIX family)